MEHKEQVLKEVLQWLTCYFTESRIQEDIIKNQLAEKDLTEEENEEGQNGQKQVVTVETRLNFEAKDPLVEVNLGIDEEPIMTKTRGLLLEKS